MFYDVIDVRNIQLSFSQGEAKVHLTNFSFQVLISARPMNGEGFALSTSLLFFYWVAFILLTRERERERHIHLSSLPLSFDYALRCLGSSYSFLFLFIFMLASADERGVLHFSTSLYIFCTSG